MEVEEGEARSYRDFGDGDSDDYDDFDPNVDPDVALSYIDEKLQDVLGHFQKDFEGVVTAENLGAKFGDYGSFLPTYQRASAWSHLKTPAKTVNHGLSTSSNKFHPENGVHLLRRREEASIGNVTKETEEMNTAQNITKASVEVGFDNLSTRKMDKIYNGLDLELSHSSSLGESPNESPSTILQIMTSFPVHENLLLSPLTEYLINLTKKQKKLRKEGKPKISKKASKTRENFVLEKETVPDILSSERFVSAASKDTINEEIFDINVHLEETTDFEEVKAGFSCETQPIVSRGRTAENVEFFGQNAKLQEGSPSLGRQKKLKGTQSRDERVNSVPKKEMEIPKAVNMYKDLFGDMELDNELDTEKTCTIERGKYDVAADKSKLAPTSAMKKKLIVEKMVTQSISEANIKSDSNVPVSQGDEAKLDKSLKKNVQLAVKNRSLNGLSHSPLPKEVEPLLLSQPNVSEKHVDIEIENGTIFDRRPSGCENQLSENSSKRALDQNGYRISKKIRTHGLHSREEDGGRERKSGKKSLLKDKEDNGSCKSEINKGKAKIYESSNESMDCRESHEQIPSVKSSKVETKVVSNKDSIDEGAKASTRIENRTKSGENNVSSIKFDEKSLGNHALPPSGKARPLNRGDYKENGVNNKSKSASESENAFEGLNIKKSPNSNGIKNSRNHEASIVLKEAKDLKHLADRFKSTGESTGFYFQAALKFLHGASLLESSSGESAKQNEANQSMQIYSSTGKLCWFCAKEYEKSKDMATAALAYKCMEVAYMRVIYSSREKASRVRLELQTASQIGVPGESPLSSASDIDNLNNPKLDKTKVVLSSPQIAAISNNVISSGDSFIRLLRYAEDVNYAMEASRKCKIAFSAANQKLEETKYKEEGIASIKRALDFNFQDVEGLLRLVRVAMEAISR